MFIKERKIQLDKLTDIQRYMQKQDKNYHDRFLNCKEFDDYLKFMRKNFYWKAGAYTVTFYVRSPTSVKLVKSKFEFKLTQDDIDKLENNLEEIRTDIEYYIKVADDPDFGGKSGNWMWINPTLSKN